MCHTLFLYWHVFCKEVVIRNKVMIQNLLVQLLSSKNLLSSACTRFFFCVTRKVDRVVPMVSIFGTKHKKNFGAFLLLK